MKNTILTITMLLSVLICKAQDKKTCAIIGTKVNNISSSLSQVSYILQNELEKLDKFIVLDKHEVEYKLKVKNIDVKKCQSITCLSDAGKALKADRVLVTTISKIGKKIIVQIRLVDMNNNHDQRTQTGEYFSLEDNLSEMIKVSLQKLFDLPYSMDMEVLLIKNDNLDNSINNPDVKRLVSHPGYIVFGGLGANNDGIMGKVEANGIYKNIFAGVCVDAFHSDHVDGSDAGWHVGYRFKIKHLSIAPSIGYGKYERTTRQLVSVEHNWILPDNYNYTYSDEYGYATPLTLRMYLQTNHRHISIGTEIGTRVENYESNLYAVIGIYVGAF